MATADHAPEGEVATGMTEDQAASELLKKWGDSEEDDPADPEDEEQDPEDDQPEGDDQPEEGGEPDDEPESGEVEIDVAGEKFKLPKAVAEQAQRIQDKAKEVEAGATRKFQEAADLRKAAELTATQATQQQQFNEAQSHLLGEHALVNRRLQLIEQMDVANIDPVVLTRLNAEYNQLSAAKSRIEAAYSRAQGLFAKDQEEVKGKRFQAAQDFAKANIKDWATDGGKRHYGYLTQRGISGDVAESWLLQDPRFLLILEDAEYGARIRNAKPGQEKRLAQVSKTLKPGAVGQSKNTAAVQADKLATRVARTGSIEDATAALLARSNALGRRRK